MVIKKRGRPKNITVPLVKSGSPYGTIEVVSPKGQKIKPTTKLKNTLKCGQKKSSKILDIFFEILLQHNLIKKNQ